VVSSHSCYCHGSSLMFTLGLRYMLSCPVGLSNAILMSASLAESASRNPSIIPNANALAMPLLLYMISPWELFS